MLLSFIIFVVVLCVCMWRYEGGVGGLGIVYNCTVVCIDHVQLYSRVYRSCTVVQSCVYFIHTLEILIQKCLCMHLVNSYVKDLTNPKNLHPNAWNYYKLSCVVNVFTRVIIVIIIALLF
jgi:hypothetical protein